MVAANPTLYLEQEFEIFITAQFRTIPLPSPAILAVMRRAFFAGAQSIYIGMHKSTGLPQSNFIDQVGDEIGNFVIGVVEKNGN